MKGWSKCLALVVNHVAWCIGVKSCRNFGAVRLSGFAVRKIIVNELQSGSVQATLGRKVWNNDDEEDEDDADDEDEDEDEDGYGNENR